MRPTRILALATAATLLAASAAWSAPKMQISESSFQFGIAPQNAKISHRFVIKSVGEDTLKIVRVIPGCGCTKAPLEKEVLAPGESTTLEIIFATGSYHGNVAKTPAIVTNESEEPIRLTFTADMTTRPDSTYPLTIDPYKIAINQSETKNRDQTSFSLTNRSDKTIHPTLVSTQDDFYAVTLPKEIGPGETVEAALKLTPKAMEQAFTKSITLQVDDEAATRFTIPIKRELRTTAGEVVPASSATPETHDHSGH